VIVLNIGENIKELRKNRNLTQTDLAEKIGVTYITIQNYENDRRQPSIETLNKIANALGVTIADLTMPTSSDVDRQYSALLVGLIDNNTIQKTINELIKKKKTLKNISEGAVIPIFELKKIQKNSDLFPIEYIIKLIEYAGLSQEEIDKCLKECNTTKNLNLNESNSKTRSFVSKIVPLNHNERDSYSNGEEFETDGFKNKMIELSNNTLSFLGLDKNQLDALDFKLTMELISFLEIATKIKYEELIKRQD
jgi:transcriptional regulator with XRE-family HTH domain